MPHAVPPCPKPQLLPLQDGDKAPVGFQDPSSSDLPWGGVRKLFFLAFTLEGSTWAWLKEIPLTLGSGRSCSPSSSARGVGRGAQCPGECRVGPRQLTPGCSTVQNREGTWCDQAPFSSPSSGDTVPTRQPHSRKPGLYTATLPIY